MFNKKMFESAASAAKSNKSKGKRGFGFGSSTVSAAGSAVSALNSKRPSTSTSKPKTTYSDPDSSGSFSAYKAVEPADILGRKVASPTMADRLSSRRTKLYSG